MNIMKLELKHLAAYLPYGLMIINNVNKEVEMTPHLFDYYMGTKIKPILRPLSNLINDIDRAYCTFGEQDNNTLKNIHLKADTQQYQDLRYSTILFLCKNHYDFQNLIPKGLALDVNEIKSTT